MGTRRHLAALTLTLALGACSSGPKGGAGPGGDASGGGEAPRRGCCVEKGAFGAADGTIVVTPGSEVSVLLPGEGWAASCDEERGIAARHGVDWNVSVRPLGEMAAEKTEQGLLESFFAKLERRLEGELDDYRVEHVERAPSERGPLLMFVSSFTDEGRPRHAASFVRAIRGSRGGWWLLHLSYEAPPSRPLTEAHLASLAMPLVASLDRGDPGRCP